MHSITALPATADLDTALACPRCEQADAGTEVPVLAYALARLGSLVQARDLPAGGGIVAAYPPVPDDVPSAALVCRACGVFLGWVA